MTTRKMEMKFLPYPFLNPSYDTETYQRFMLFDVTANLFPWERTAMTRLFSQKMDQNSYPMPSLLGQGRMKKTEQSVLRYGCGRFVGSVAKVHARKV